MHSDQAMLVGSRKRQRAWAHPANLGLKTHTLITTGKAWCSTMNKEKDT